MILHCIRLVVALAALVYVHGHFIPMCLNDGGYELHWARDGRVRCCKVITCPKGSYSILCSDNDMDTTWCKPCDGDTHFMDTDTSSLNQIPCQRKRSCSQNKGMKPVNVNTDQTEDTTVCHCDDTLGYYDPNALYNDSSYSASSCYRCSTTGYYVNEHGHCVLCEEDLTRHSDGRIICEAPETSSEAIIATSSSTRIYPSSTDNMTGATLTYGEDSISNAFSVRFAVGVCITLGVVMVVLVVVMFSRRRRRVLCFGIIKKCSDLDGLRPEDDLQHVQSQDHAHNVPTDQSHDPPEAQPSDSPDELPRSRDDEETALLSNEDSLPQRTDPDGGNDPNTVGRRRRDTIVGPTIVVEGGPTHVGDKADPPSPSTEVELDEEQHDAGSTQHRQEPAVEADDVTDVNELEIRERRVNTEEGGV